jgi:hypothetical protein
VATLVLGGIGTRLELPYERMDDLQLAVLSLLDASSADETSVEIDVHESSLAVSVGPLAPGSAADQGLGRVLGRLSDETSSELRDGSEWITLHVARQARSAA